MMPAKRKRSCCIGGVITLGENVEDQNNRCEERKNEIDGAAIHSSEKRFSLKSTTAVSAHSGMRFRKVVRGIIRT